MSTATHEICVAEAAYNLGHAAGLLGATPRLPRHFDRDQARAYRDGWRAGDAQRRDAGATEGGDS